MQRLFVTWMWICLQAYGALGGELPALERVGKAIFFDKNLSNPVGQSCASCHAPEAGFTGPSSEINQTTGVYPGAVAHKFGNRKPPTVAYASYSPRRAFVKEDDTYVGGQFWDGRANHLVEQAKGPFLNPLEMNNPDAKSVVAKIAKANYRPLFEQAFGPEAFTGGVEAIFERVAVAITAYEESPEVNAFSSKYDAYLAGQAVLTAAEQRGLELFAGKAKCSNCHPHERSLDGTPPLFTDFTYDNLGLPRNPRNPFYKALREENPLGAKYVDPGLGGSLNEQDRWGEFKVPTLRNVARRPDELFVKSYGHNGTFRSLKEIVHFYNVRDSRPQEFPPAEYAATVNREELGNLGLTDRDENDLIAFLETLSDGYVSRPTNGPRVVDISQTRPNEPMAPSSMQYVEDLTRMHRATVGRATRR